MSKGSRGVSKVLLFFVLTTMFILPTQVFATQYANVVVVAKTGGDFTDPVAAVGSIGNASATNPYLIKIMPGIYDISSTSLWMKPYVDIEGSGQDTTTIVENGGILGAPNAEIRSLTIKGTNAGVMWARSNMSNVKIDVNSTNGTAYGMEAVGATIKLSNVEILANGVSSAYGINMTTDPDTYVGSNVELNNVKVTASVSTLYLEPAGIYVQDDCILTMNNSSVIVNAPTNQGIGVKNAGYAEISNSAIKANKVISNISSLAKMYINNTKLDGSSISTIGVLKCYNDFDKNYAAYLCQ